MTWTWNIIRWGVGIVGLATQGTIDPSGWVGGTAGELFKQNRYHVFNKTDENLNEREVNLRLIQLVESYQSVSIGGQVCRGCGKVYRSDDKVKTLLELGIDFTVGKIIDKGIEKLLDKPARIFLTQRSLKKVQMKHNLKSCVAADIFIHYLVLCKTKTDPHPNTKKWIEKGIEIIRAWPWEASYKNEIDVVIATLQIHEQNLEYILESKELIRAERKFIWQMNEENISIYVQTESNLEKHCAANELVNSCLRQLRKAEGGKGKDKESYGAWEDLDPSESLSFLNKLTLFLQNHEEVLGSSSQLIEIIRSFLNFFRR